MIVLLFTLALPREVKLTSKEPAFNILSGSGAKYHHITESVDSASGGEELIPCDRREQREGMALTKLNPRPRRILVRECDWSLQTSALSVACRPVALCPTQTLVRWWRFWL